MAEIEPYDGNLLMNISFRGDPQTPVVIAWTNAPDNLKDAMYHVHNTAGTCVKNVYGDECTKV